MADFLTALGQFGQSLAPLGQMDTERRNYEHMNKVFAANPDFAAKMYGTMKNGGADDLPSNIREWNIFSRMTDEQKKQYLAMKRAQQFTDLGGSVVAQNPLDPTSPLAQYGKTLLPGEQPGIRGMQAGAAELAKIAATQSGESNKKAASAQSTISTLEEARKILPDASSGGLEAGLTGTAKFFGKSTKSSKSDAKLKVLSATLVQNVPRMEGPQSDRDTQMYKEAAANIGDNMLPYEDRLAAIDTIETLQSKYASGDTGNLPVPEMDAANAALDIVKGAATKPPSINKSKVLKYNPVTGDFE
jgi:hypothetical protein